MSVPVLTHRRDVYKRQDLIHANSSVKDALLFNLLSYLSDQLLTKGNTVAALDELYQMCIRDRIKHIESGATYTGTTGTGGSYTFTELKPGAYEIRELSAPEGWERDSQTYTTTVVAGDCVTYTPVSYTHLHPRAPP